MQLSLLHTVSCYKHTDGLSKCHTKRRKTFFTGSNSNIRRKIVALSSTNTSDIMKKRLLMCAAAMGVALLCFSPAAAQNAKIVRIGALPDGEISQPRTVLRVNVVASGVETTPGPYARYAQKYLGVAAPLADKVVHEIKSVNISEVKKLVTARNTKVDTGADTKAESVFSGLSVDVTSNTQQSLEERARAAAEQIFRLRRSRLELITGDAGENVFGGGLASALDEISRLEGEYLALFLGRQTVTTTRRTYTIIPQQNVSTYTVCRFSDVDGLLPLDDLSGSPLVLELKALADTGVEGVEITAKPGSKNPAYRIAADVQCRIIFNGAELASAVIPVYQLGRTVHLAK
jgi:hypothetical protein